jgi:hypothetical protein
MLALIKVQKTCFWVALSVALLSCSPATPPAPAATASSDNASVSTPCAFSEPPPTPTPGPPTPTLTPFPTSPFSEEDFPPYIELPPRPTPGIRAKGIFPSCHHSQYTCGVPSADAARLRAGVDHPTDLSEFDRFFPDEAACERYFERLRWSNGFG